MNILVRKFIIIDGNRYSVSTEALDKSALNTSSCTNRTREATPNFCALALDSLTRSASMMMNLRTKIFNELKPGTRVVSHDYHFGDWSADDSISFEVPEKESVTGVPKATVLLWFVPARVAGTWEVKTAAGDTYQVALNQRFQVIDGTASAGGRPVKAQNLTLRGNDISFALPDAKGQARFTGRINGDAMEGSLEAPGKAAQRWTAMRTAAGKVVIE